MLARAASWLDRAAFSPDTLPDDLVMGVALAPPVIAGLVIFKLPAVEMLGIALAAGIAAELVSRLLWRRLIPKPETSPIIAAVIGIALIGVGAPLLLSGEVAVLAVVLEVLRARYTPAVHAQPGLIAWAVVTLASRGATMAWVNPSGANNDEPIAIWHLLPSDPIPVDPVHLYVGSEPGPVFATSLMAIAIAIAWLAYARRLSPVVALCFLLGALVPIAVFHWDFVFQLDNGPLWFVGGLILSDRRNLPSSWATRPLLGFVAGAISVGLRSPVYGNRGLEAALFTVAAMQAFVGLVVVVIWAVKNTSRRRERSRLLRRRDEQLRAINRTDEPADPTAA
ncbi:MAG TPA: RnfABCDGE type electron transport complex subunit D [Candidatus Dormibacteraeota bacterium]|nr:RnfABCDGE type electron transport complex subunit D [Candidatus Dormibacteraeota bacterium]